MDINQIDKIKPFSRQDQGKCATKVFNSQSQSQALPQKNKSQSNGPMRSSLNDDSGDENAEKPFTFRGRLASHSSLIKSKFSSNLSRLSLKV
jgi:hypothetical protein